MKLLAAIFLLASLTLNAQTLRSLKDVMSDMGTTFKSITLAINSGKITDQTINDGKFLLSLVQESSAITPDTINELSTEEQAAAKENYLAEIKKLESEVVELNIALSNGDIATAKSLLAELNATKKQGHMDYK